LGHSGLAEGQTRNPDRYVMLLFWIPGSRLRRAPE